MKVERHRAAQQVVAEASRYYAAESAELAEQFVTDFDQTVQRIRRLPNAWPPPSKGLRRCLLSKFPYQINYRVEGETIRIYAVAHIKRRPGYWTRRVTR